MQLEELKGKIANEVIESLEARHISTLTPPQGLAIRAGLLEGNNVLVSSPTASGKTLIAELAMLNTVFKKRKKAVYIAPMRALVSEKYDEFKSNYPYLNIAMSIGDLDSLDPWLAKYDIIFVSTEKLDSLIRHGITWLGSVGCIVFDEVHMIGEEGRGPTLEILITKLRRLSKDAQIIGLSATIGNARDIAEWLGAELVESNYRPVKLEKGIVLKDSVYYIDREETLAGSSIIPEVRVAEDVLERGKQLLVFYSTKRNAEAGAERMKNVVRERLNSEEKEKLQELSDEILHALSSPTEQCRKLSELVKNGVAFHHAGLVNEQRHAVESAFRSGLIKVVCSTTTLSLGINMPAHTVVVRDTSRYGDTNGAEKLSVNEVTQLFGRAGRPAYDKEGRGLLLARSREEIMDLYRRYIDAELEPIDSNLGMLPVLRTHVLSSIATNFLRSKEALTNFIGETFYGYEYSDMRGISKILERILNEFVSWGFVEKRGSIYNATRIGIRVSELYIDPLSAKWLIDSLQKKRQEVDTLFMIANTAEMRPYVKVTKEAEEEFVYTQQVFGMSQMEEEFDELGYYYPEKPFSTALMLRDWINEMKEDEICKRYATTPGTLFNKITNADWLLYASMELGKLMHVRTTDILELRVRIRYGIKKELLNLVRLEQVGRVRARLMFNNGIKSVEQLREQSAQAMVRRLFTKEIAEKILSQVNTVE